MILIYSLPYYIVFNLYRYQIAQRKQRKPVDRKLSNEDNKIQDRSIRRKQTIRHQDLIVIAVVRDHVYGNDKLSSHGTEVQSFCCRASKNKVRKEEVICE